MKYLTLFFFTIVLSRSIYSQTLKDRIQGDWICLGIVNEKGEPAKGKFGESSEFLKFSFSESKTLVSGLLVSEAPFDKAIRNLITFKNENSFVWIYAIDLPETFYEVKELDDNHLVLTTKNESGEIINYNFSSQRNFPFNTNDEIIDNGILIVKHLRSSKNRSSINRVSEYRISSDSIFLSPRPTFEYLGGRSFGDMLSFNIKLPKGFKLNEPTDEMILEFDVSQDGAGNFKNH